MFEADLNLIKAEVNKQIAGVTVTTDGFLVRLTSEFHTTMRSSDCVNLDSIKILINEHKKILSLKVIK